jgi:type IV secretion system protein TrbB
MTALEQAEQEKQNRLLNNLFSDMQELIPYLDDDTVTDISVQDSGEIIVSSFGKGRIFTGKTLSPVITQRIILAAANLNGRTINASSGFPVFEGIIPKYNARITGLMPPNVTRSEISIRKPPKMIFTLESYVSCARMTKEQYEIIVQAIQKDKNIVVTGSTGSGKTTLLNAIIYKMSELAPDKNFYIVEDVPEIQCNAKMKSLLWVPSECAEKAVYEALRWNPDKVFFGEVRNGSVMKILYMLLNSGHNGSATSMHANSCALALQKIKNWLGGEYNEYLSDIIQIIIHLKKTREGIRVDEIMQVEKDTVDSAT